MQMRKFRVSRMLSKENSVFRKIPRIKSKTRAVAQKSGKGKIPLPPTD